MTNSSLVLSGPNHSETRIFEDMKHEFFDLVLWVFCLLLGCVGWLYGWFLPPQPGLFATLGTAFIALAVGRWLSKNLLPVALFHALGVFFFCIFVCAAVADAWSHFSSQDDLAVFDHMEFGFTVPQGEYAPGDKIPVVFTNSKRAPAGFAPGKLTGYHHLLREVNFTVEDREHCFKTPVVYTGNTTAEFSVSCTEGYSGPINVSATFRDRVYHITYLPTPSM